ncbi:hypothetical protein [Eggerthella sp. YY7918]|uniref:hypothetical protein n=1 Tax=Eggerthella sp. (strain YY7918) TaxID=502558 RepID=UPI000217168C|nr:hypothetical protein [Eggerthella sp. YY7918]BAK44458.1 membrane protein involved in the export of O-antigen [Eggerthella sp. YY7918]
MLFKQQGKDYTDTEGSVRYLDGSSLLRPLSMPRPQLLIAGAFVVAAAIIGALLLHNVLDTIYGSAARAQASMEENLAREVSYDLPLLSSLIQLDDAGIKQAFTDAGYTTYETSNPEELPNGGFTLIKLPSDVSVEEAGVLYLKGMSKLSAAEAARLLNGSWTITVDRDQALDMSVKYADFSSGSLEAAIDAAIATEGFDPATATEVTQDEVGNTFRSGTIDVNGASYAWRVSAIALSEMYDISGLPEDAVYVGIRMMPA